MVFIYLSKRYNSPTAVSYYISSGRLLLPNLQLIYIEYGGK